MYNKVITNGREIAYAALQSAEFEAVISSQTVAWSLSAIGSTLGRAVNELGEETCIDTVVIRSDCTMVFLAELDGKYFALTGLNYDAASNTLFYGGAEPTGTIHPSQVTDADIANPEYMYAFLVNYNMHADPIAVGMVTIQECH